jgi:hypothetical protein
MAIFDDFGLNMTIYQATVLVAQACYFHSARGPRLGGIWCIDLIIAVLYWIIL